MFNRIFFSVLSFPLYITLQTTKQIALLNQTVYSSTLCSLFYEDWLNFSTPTHWFNIVLFIFIFFFYFSDAYIDIFRCIVNTNKSIHSILIHFAYMYCGGFDAWKEMQKPISLKMSVSTGDNHFGQLRCNLHTLLHKILVIWPIFTVIFNHERASVHVQLLYVFLLFHFKIDWLLYVELLGCPVAHWCNIIIFSFSHTDWEIAFNTWNLTNYFVWVYNFFLRWIFIPGWSSRFVWEEQSSLLALCCAIAEWINGFRTVSSVCVERVSKPK